MAVLKLEGRISDLQIKSLPYIRLKKVYFSSPVKELHLFPKNAARMVGTKEPPLLITKKSFLCYKHHEDVGRTFAT